MIHLHPSGALFLAHFHWGVTSCIGHSKGLGIICIFLLPTYRKFSNLKLLVMHLASSPSGDIGHTLRPAIHRQDTNHNHTPRCAAVSDPRCSRYAFYLLLVQ